MPWKDLDVKNQRLEFVLRALSESTPFVELCNEYGIVAKTGYKWRKRFLEKGIAGLGDRSRRPSHSPRELREEVVCEIVRIKQAHKKWGPRKIRGVYARQRPGEELPSESSFKRILDRAGLVEKRHRRKIQSGGRLQNRRAAKAPNEVWTVDFKGWWYTPDGERCEPLTIRDDFSRFVLCASTPGNARSATIRSEFEKVFSRYGLPHSIRSDNGRPFSVPTAPLGLSQLSAWWLALGIDLDRIDPGCPSQNGGHERMHRDIATELEGRIEGNLCRHGEALESWRQIFNHQRPHEALGMLRPAEVYRKSTRSYRGTPDNLDYPNDFKQRKVTTTGTIRVEGTLIHISSALRGWNVGLKYFGERQYSVHFVGLCLGQIDLDTESFQVAGLG